MGDAALFYRPDWHPDEHEIHNRITSAHRRMTHLEKRQDAILRDITHLQHTLDLIRQHDTRPWWRRIFR
jgi:hypothetical protein